MEAVYPLFTQHTFQWDARQNGYIFAYVGVVIVLMQGGLVGQLVKLLGERALLVGGLMLLAGGLFLLSQSTTLALMLVALAALSAGEGAVTPTTSALLSMAAPTEAQGETLGVAQGMAALGRILGPVAAGALFSVDVGVPFLAGGALVLLTALLALGKMPRRPRGKGNMQTLTQTAVQAAAPADALQETIGDR
jgi:MFS family permease